MILVGLALGDFSAIRYYYLHTMTHTYFTMMPVACKVMLNVSVLLFHFFFFRASFSDLSPGIKTVAVAQTQGNRAKNSNEKEIYKQKRRH